MQHIKEAHFILVIISVLFKATTNLELEDPIVDIKYGLVKGLEETSRSGRVFYSFRGMPYAKPPVDHLRFRPPEDPVPWKGIFDAQKNPPRCMQKNYLFENPKVEGLEDCLYLNVYTPKLRVSLDSSDELLPVMVFIHWGGFFAGYSGSDYLGPEYFMDKDVVLVTFNYRLGVLGFFSTNDDSAPGNYGLKDQTAALRWVQENIEKFGGNKKRVTLFGQSAGGASVHYHILSPESKYLFHQGISMSGTALALWAKPFPKQQMLIAKAQARLVGCQRAKTSQNMVECIRKIKAEDLVKSGDKFKYFSIDPLNVYQPSIEKRTEKNSKPFITKSPIEYIRSKEFLQVPWIIGIVNNEGLIRAARALGGVRHTLLSSLEIIPACRDSVEHLAGIACRRLLLSARYVRSDNTRLDSTTTHFVDLGSSCRALLRQPETRAYLRQHFNELMPNLMGLTLSNLPERSEQIWTKIKQNYFKGIDRNAESWDETNIKGLINLYTDRSFTYSSYQSALFHKVKGHQDMWFYHFNYTGQYSYGNLFAATKDNINYDWGVSHCDDLIYLFKSAALLPEISSPNDLHMSKKMIKMWTDFATYGDPTPRLHIWEKIEKSVNKKLKHISFEGHYQDLRPPKRLMKIEIENIRFKFWENIPLLENIEELNQTHVEL